MSTITDISIDVLTIILSEAVTSAALQTCKKWLNIILNLPIDIKCHQINLMVDAVANGALNIKQIPASMYELLTFGHKVLIPNILASANNTTIVNNYRYNIAWKDIIAVPYIVITPEYRKTMPVFITGETSMKAIHKHYFTYVFKHFEQYRRHIIGLHMQMPSEVSIVLASNNLRESTDSKYMTTLWDCCSINVALLACIMTDFIVISI